MKRILFVLIAMLAGLNLYAHAQKATAADKTTVDRAAAGDMPDDPGPLATDALASAEAEGD